MKSLLFGLSLIASTPPAAAHTNSCRAVDLRPQLGEARDQGASGWCFAHTSADLITQKLGVRVSAFDIAATFLLADVRELPKMSGPLSREYFRMHPNYVESVKSARVDHEAYARDKILSEKGLLKVGGVENLAIVAANGKGLCLDERLPSELPGRSYEDNLNAIERFRKHLSGQERAEIRQSFAYLDHIQDLGAREAAGAFSVWVDAQCGRRVPASELIPQEYYIANDADGLDTLPPHVTRQRQRLLQQVIGDLLDQGRAVAIGYDANDVMTRDPDDRELHADHSSIIAARRPSARGCEFYVRNSFGSGCDDFRPDFQKACEGGGVWVTMDQLPSLYSAVWLDE